MFAVQKYYIHKLSVVVTSAEDVSNKTVNHALKYIFNDSIKEISANITLRIYNGHIAHVIYMLIQDPKLELDDNRMKSKDPSGRGVVNLINDGKLKHFIKMFQKYVAIRLIQENPGTRSGKVMNTLYNKQCEWMKDEINGLITNNKRIYSPEVSSYAADEHETEYFSCENIIDTASYNGEPYENNDDLADWF